MVLLVQLADIARVDALPMDIRALRLLSTGHGEAVMLVVVVARVVAGIVDVLLLVNADVVNAVLSALVDVTAVARDLGGRCFWSLTKLPPWPSWLLLLLSMSPGWYCSCW